MHGDILWDRNDVCSNPTLVRDWRGRSATLRGFNIDKDVLEEELASIGCPLLSTVQTSIDSERKGYEVSGSHVFFAHLSSPKSRD